MIRLLAPKSAPSRRLAASFASNVNVNVNANVGRSGRCNNPRGLHTVSLQLDYYMSPQFAGVARAVTDGLYERAGIDLEFLPICPVGLEMRRVRDKSDASSSSSSMTIGSVEQNIFIPTLCDDPGLRVRAVAANFRRSPLCLASLASSSSSAHDEAGKKVVVGAHDDTVSLIERILSSGPDAERYSVISSPRATKIADLKSGAVNSIQAYTTTEVPTLERQLDGSNYDEDDTAVVRVDMLEGMNGAKLGYSQVLFAPEEDLVGDRRDVVRAFLDATFRGWETAIRDNEGAARSVDECRAKLGLDDENNDHWEGSFSYTVQNVGLCCDAVKETFQGDRLGVIDAERWNEATEWLLDGKSPPGGGGGGSGSGGGEGKGDFGADTSGVWQPSSKLLAGNELARKTLEGAKESAEKFRNAHGRKPSLAVITVGELARYTHAEKRMRYFSNGDLSWFSKTSAGEANGFDVKEINLPESATTETILSAIYAHSDVDAFQLMWPLPDHVDAAACYNAIDVSKDADGAHYVGQLELDPNGVEAPTPPVTPAAAVELLDDYGVDVSNRAVLVVGRSRIVGSPLARMLTGRGAIVTLAHSETSADMLRSLAGNADVVVSCAGVPGLVDAGWLKDGAVALSVGTTFVEEEDALLSDFGGGKDLADSPASRFSPVPGGIGPLSLPLLLRNVVRCARSRMERTGDVEATWTEKSGALERTFHFKDYDAALAFANGVNEMSAGMDHHANMTFGHRCVDGVDVTLSYFTYEANRITGKDYDAAKAVNAIAATVS
eukprot:CAMPEP_0113570942 /NCGR_PEP_ID=MMETSP0015_2-20120614/25276_1 /TAXON_ID=2838 /ORGANISM="Odontella" /LENGTH=778 /DNA_ID=CAMNT_0000473833 /DNA_START=385 /DNA_END=2721 /DNA_ORIENTATION=- /assembly_acc=CAM_ASM_000160